MKPNNPYKNIDWNTIQYIHSYSHVHNRPEPSLSEDRAVKVQRQPMIQYPYQYKKIRFFNFTNHTFGIPVTYPLEDWFDEVPVNVLGSPGHEHRAFGQHFVQIGSTQPQVDARYEHNYESVNDLMNDIITNYQYTDAGGVHSNHNSDATWAIQRLIDYPDDFLGIEIFNGKRYLWKQLGDHRDAWDSILASGIQCWGFANPDGFAVPPEYTDTYEQKTLYGGSMRNILLIDEFTEEKCARAYRHGQFFTSFQGSDLIFTYLSFDEKENSLHIQTNIEAKIKVITDRGIYNIFGSSVEFSIPKSSVYCRVTAEKYQEIICSQPFMLKKIKILCNERYVS